MIIPIRCKSCGKPIGHLHEEYLEKSRKEDPAKVMDQLGLKRYCCRSHFIGYANLIETTAQFKKF
ncbi:MAG: DNA-directed RNA polymerase subunit N [Nanoarchaeota archaeon]